MTIHREVSWDFSFDRWHGLPVLRSYVRAEEEGVYRKETGSCADDNRYSGQSDAVCYSRAEYVLHEMMMYF